MTSTFLRLLYSYRYVLLIMNGNSNSFLFYISAFAFHVELKPKSAFFRVGDRQELRCSVKDCNEKVTMSWALLGDKPMFAKIHTSGSESVAAFDPVMTVHDDILLCKVSCGALTKQQRVVVKVYCKSIKLDSVSHHKPL